MTTGQIKQAEVDPAPEAPVEGASTAAFPRWIWLCLAAGVLALGFVIYTGIHARTTAESNLVQATDESSLPTVAVVHPIPSGSAAQEIVLPGNVMAFIDTPIYARTSGYLKAWYADIGAHGSSRGNYWPPSALPKWINNCMQARADVVTAQTNAGLAQSQRHPLPGTIAAECGYPAGHGYLRLPGAGHQFRGQSGPGQCPAPRRDAIV